MKRSATAQQSQPITPEMHLQLAGQPNAILHGYSPLDIAIARNDVDQAIVLLNNLNTQNNQQNAHGFTPFHLAIYAGNMQIISAFIKNNQQWVNERDQQQALPIHWAALAGNHYVISPLIAAGANIYNKNGVGQTAYDIALPLGGNLNPLMGANNNHQRVMEVLMLAHTYNTMDNESSGNTFELHAPSPNYISSPMGTAANSHAQQQPFDDNDNNNAQQPFGNVKRWKQDNQ